MNSSLAGVLQIVLLVAALAVCYKPLGDYMARVFTSPKHLRVEKGFYRVMGIDPEADQRWGTYARSMLAFSGVCVLFLYLLERIQHCLPYSNGQPAVPPFLAWNTAASFVTNTNWQNYSGESTMGYVVQMAGLAVQNFVSAAVGIVVVIALIRGFMRNKTDRLGNFWVDLTRVVIRVLLPLVGGRRHHPDGHRRDRQLQRHARDHHADRRPADAWSAARWPRRRPSRSSAPTAAASSTRTPRTRSRTRTRSPTGSRSSCCSSSRSRCRAPSARWSATTGRATLLVGVMALLWLVSVGRHHLLRMAARGHRAAGRGRRDGGQGGPVRHPRLVAVRRVDDRHLDRSGQQLPRLVHRVRRRHPCST